MLLHQAIEETPLKGVSQLSLREKGKVLLEAGWIQPQVKKGCGSLGAEKLGAEG